MELLFKYKQKEVRTLEVNGEVQFVAKDVCDILELDNVSLAVNGRPDRRGVPPARSDSLCPSGAAFVSTDSVAPSGFLEVGR